MPISPRSRARWRTATRVAAAPLLAFLAFLAFLAWERLSFDREAWLADYQQLREHVPAVYANFEWALRERSIDPLQLHEQTSQALAAATTDRQARAAIAAFVDTFDDGHFMVRRVKLSKRLDAVWSTLWEQTGAPPVTGETSGEVACRAFGFADQAAEIAFGLAEDPHFTALAQTDNAFAAGTLALADGRKIGLVRVPIFDQHRYGSACVRAWERDRGGLAGPCDDDCVDHFVHIAAPNQLLADLGQRIRDLADVDLLVVDITGNGGGTDWVDPAARLFSPKPLQCPRLAFLKHPHWSGRLAKLLREVDDDLRGERSPDDRATLQDARARLSRLLAAAEIPCDLASIWTDPARPACSRLVDDEYYACGVFAHLPPGSLVGVSSRGALFKALRYDYTPGTYQGPLAVLVDDRSASAAEHFAAMLADNEAAVIVGARTAGSGCGFTNGGVPALLHHSGLRVDMPDCQRRRRDGSNELAGITPDIVIDWSRGEDEATRSSKLLAGLAQIRPLRPTPGGRPAGCGCVDRRRGHRRYRPQTRPSNRDEITEINRALTLDASAAPA